MDRSLPFVGWLFSLTFCACLAVEPSVARADEPPPKGIAMAPAPAPAPAKKQTAFTLLAGVSGGRLGQHLFTGQSHPRLDLWTTARLHFVDIGLFVQTLAVVLDNEPPTDEWITDRNRPGTKATGLSVGAQLGLHVWTADDADVAVRFGLTGRAGRAGFEATTDEDQSLAVDGYLGELMGSVGVGNSVRTPNRQRWAVLAFFGYSAVGVDTVNTPAGVFGVRDTTQWVAVGLGFEIGYNVPLPL